MTRTVARTAAPCRDLAARAVRAGPATDAYGRYVVDAEVTVPAFTPESAAARLRLLTAALAETKITGVVRPVGGYPVLYLIDPPAPWAVSVGAVHFWLGDPAEIICPNDRVLEAAWVLAERLGRRP